MCQYSFLGIIIFKILPPIIIGGILAILLVKVIKIGKLSLTWKIGSIVLALVLIFIIWMRFDDLIVMYNLDTRLFFWQCDDSLFKGAKYFN